MALTTLPTAALANDAVDNTKLDLADNYAFTGTVSGTPQGMTLINSTSSTTTVGQFNIDNVFSSTYKFYRVYMRVEYSQNTGFEMRMLDSSGTARTANYYYNDLSMFNNGTSALYYGTNVSSWFNGRPSGGNVAGGGNRGHHYVIDFYDPYGTSVTHTFQKLMGWHDTAGFYYSGTFIGHNTNQEAHRGFTVLGNSSPNIIQHDVKVYGVTNV
jgi:hypothetical protein